MYTVSTPDEIYPETLMLGAGVVSGLILGLGTRLVLDEHSLNISQALAAILIIIVIASFIGFLAPIKGFGNKGLGFIIFILGLLIMFCLTLLGTNTPY